MNNKTKVFLVTTYFPPIISVASNRMEAIAKYLDEDQFELEVITTDIEGGSVKDIVNPDYLVTRLSNNTLFKKASFTKTNSYIIHKTKALYNKVLAIFVKNEFFSWQTKVVKELEQRIKKHSKSIVISSFSPSAPHLAILELKRRKFDFIWLADFRDSMTNPSVSSVLVNTNAVIQKKVLDQAEAVVTVSEPIIKEFAKQSTSSSTKTFEVRNGFDFDMKLEAKFNSVFTISYIGSFYGSRKPNYFFRGLSKFLEKHPGLIINIQLIGVGNSIQVPEFIQKQTLVTNKVTHNEALEFMLNSDALLLLHPQSEYKGVFTGKLFEYLGCLKPIIAAVDKEDVAAQLILDCNAGFIASFEDVDENEQAITKAFQLWQEQKQLKMNIPLIKEQHRKVQIDKLNQIIRNLISKQ